MPRTSDEIRADIAKAEAAWSANDPMAGHFTHGAGRGGRASRSQSRAAERRANRSFAISRKLNEFYQELREAERCEELRAKAPVLEKRLADFTEIQRTGLTPSGDKLSKDERAAVKSIIRDLRIQLRRAA